MLTMSEGSFDVASAREDPPQCKGISSTLIVFIGHLWSRSAQMESPAELNNIQFDIPSFLTLCPPNLRLNSPTKCVNALSSDFENYEYFDRPLSHGFDPNNFSGILGAICAWFVLHLHLFACFSRFSGFCRPFPPHFLVRP